jgi:hypothetical protein
MPADSTHGLACDLPRGEIVAEIDRLQMRVLRAVGCEPAGGCTMFAVLLVGAVLGRYELRLQWQRPLDAGGHDHGRDHRMKMLGFAVGAGSAGAVGACELLRAEVLRTIKRDQHVSFCLLASGKTEPLERIKPAAGLDRSQHVRKHRIQRLWRHRIEHGADVVVGRYFLHAQQRLAVRRATPTLQCSLMRQERRALQEEHAKRAHADVRHRIRRVVTLPPVRQGRTKRLERCDERFENHPQCES